MAKHGKLQTRLEYAATRTVLNALGLLSPRAAMSAGQAISLLGYHSLPHLTSTGERNLQMALPHLPVAQRRRLLRGCFASLGRQLGLFSQFGSAKPEELLALAEFEGLHHLEAAKSQGRGVILFTGHLGAWEFTSFGLSLLGQPLSFLVRRLDNELIEKLVDQSRTRFGNHTLDKLSAARSMVKILRSGEVLGLLIDLNTLDDEAIFVDFFGIPASTNFVVAKLALRTQAPIVPIFAPWDNELKKFVIRIDEPVSFQHTGDQERDVRELTMKLSSVTEEYIRRYPEQWLWIHKRWKTRPPGKKDLYE